jgi:uncharacterized RDD family membrane protein YckC
LINNPIVKPFKNGFDGLVRRGEGRVDHWKQLGMDEDTQGRELIETITFSTIDTSIDYVAQQPEVYELATSRTKSFASVILDYLRGILVSLDIILLGIFAKVFRLSYLMKPEPPSEEIRKGATWSILASDEILDSGEHQDNTYFGYFAGFINRISAKFLDLFIVGIMLNIGIWFIRNSAVLLNAFRTDINFFDLDLTQPIIISIIGAAMFAFYNALLWTLFGSTFGQALLGIRVLTKDGSLPGPIRSFLRATLGIAIAVTIFILTFFFIVFDKRRRSIHDRLFGTVVVYTWDARPSQRFMKKYVDKVFELRNELDSE